MGAKILKDTKSRAQRQIENAVFGSGVVLRLLRMRGAARYEVWPPERATGGVLDILSRVSAF